MAGSLFPEESPDKSGSADKSGSSGRSGSGQAQPGDDSGSARDTGSTRSGKTSDSTPARPMSVPPTASGAPAPGNPAQPSGVTSSRPERRPSSAPTLLGKRSWWRPPRKLRVTREGKYFIGITFGVGFAAINTGNNLLYLLLGMLLALIVVSSVMSELSLRRLTVVRRLPPRAQVGRPHLVEVEVHNHKGKIPSYAIEIEDLREGQPADKRCFFLKISPDSAQIAAYRRTPARRGRDRHVGFRIATRFPFGLFEKSRETGAEGEIIIYPATDPLHLPAKADGRWLGADGKFGPGSGDEILGVRPMREGDDHRDIYWRKSASGRQMVLRERARETSRQVHLMLDSEHPGETPDGAWLDQFEVRIREVASRAVAHIKRGDWVTVQSTAGESVIGNSSVGADPVLRFLALVESSPAGQRSTHAARRLARAAPKPQGPGRPPAARARALESEPVPPSGASGRRARA